VNAGLAAGKFGFAETATAIGGRVPGDALGRGDSQPSCAYASAIASVKNRQEAARGKSRILAEDERIARHVLPRSVLESTAQSSSPRVPGTNHRKATSTNLVKEDSTSNVSSTAVAPSWSRRAFARFLSARPHPHPADARIFNYFAGTWKRVEGQVVAGAQGRGVMLLVIGHAERRLGRLTSSSRRVIRVESREHTRASWRADSRPRAHPAG
jgi:hypothetical protein